MKSADELLKEIMSEIPDSVLLQEQDKAIIISHKDKLLSWRDEIVKQFYDTLFSNEKTRAIFREGERPEREKTLEAWWERTVSGPFDDDYYKWMTFVGFIHVARRVTNPMMLAMTSFVSNFVAEKAKAEGLENGTQLAQSFSKLMNLVAIIIASSYDRAFAASIEEITGMSAQLQAVSGSEGVKAFIAELSKQVKR
jgi:hypothetical protein